MKRRPFAKEPTRGRLKKNIGSGCHATIFCLPYQASEVLLVVSNYCKQKYSFVHLSLNPRARLATGQGWHPPLPPWSWPYRGRREGFGPVPDLQQQNGDGAHGHVLSWPTIRRLPISRGLIDDRENERADGVGHTASSTTCDANIHVASA